ncbi:C4-dicarboxylate transporter/malic acid transport protein [Macrophomina phaseolina MS6]|uniref:C4-dicarboxylate transporter/malic acid transport protein n=1 Tax=Macrophomina phaseolina (strain MS6) TaxID=1126212 RepID=K2STU0_MACPH|nr:C4-dicarboxylate transporter/malic acid transport protein [Macrophomina phaseolina MS6]
MAESSSRPLSIHSTPSPGPDSSANGHANPFLSAASPRSSTSSERSTKESSAPNTGAQRPSIVHWPDQDRDPSPMSLQNGTNTKAQDNDCAEKEEPQRLSLRERIRHFTWTWFTMTMATGGIANVLHNVPFRFNGLYEIGCVIFLLNVALFIFNVVMISLRFYFYPSTFRASFLHPTECLFIPASVISFGTILLNISQYGVDFTGSWLEDAMVVLYWVYCGMAIVFSCGIYLIMWSTQTFTISKMTPVWIFPAYPLLIVGPHAGNLAKKTAADRSLDIIIGGVVLQGIGFMVSLMIYAAFLYRLMTQKLPRESLRPGMFISVGPSGFTISGIISMGQILPNCVPADFMGDGQLAGQVSKILANWVGIWLWGLALWFFFVSVGAHASPATRRKMDFAMTWYSFIFPNTALTTATFSVAKALNNNHAINVVGCVLTVGLIPLWFFVVYMQIRALLTRQIMWPQKQEDRDEGGFKETPQHGQTRNERRRERVVIELDNEGPYQGGRNPAPTPFSRTPWASNTNLPEQMHQMEQARMQEHLNRSLHRRKTDLLIP